MTQTTQQGSRCDPRAVSFRVPSNKSAVLAASAAEHAVYAPAHHVSTLRSTRLLIHQWDEWLPSGSPPQLLTAALAANELNSSRIPLYRAPFEIRELILRRQECLRGGRRRRRVFILASGAVVACVVVACVVVREGELVLATLKTEATTKPGS